MNAAIPASFEECLSAVDKKLAQTFVNVKETVRRGVAAFVASTTALVGGASISATAGDQPSTLRSPTTVSGDASGNFLANPLAPNIVP